MAENVSSKKLKVAPGHILIRPDEAETTLKSGIILPDEAAKERSAGRGTVVSVGERRMSPHGAFYPMPVKPGDRVFWQRSSGPRFELSDGPFRIVDQEDLLAVIQ